jgi:hypothetical protein
MWIACAAIGSLGFLLGWWLRVPAVVAASGVTAVVCILASMGLGRASTVAVTLTLVSLLQIGYLTGLMLSSLRMTARPTYSLASSNRVRLSPSASDCSPQSSKT